MKSISGQIKLHKALLAIEKPTKTFMNYHLTQIRFLQHERLVHLIVTFFVIFFALGFLCLFFIVENIMFLFLFILLLILSVFYIFHYYKLENTVIEWYQIYNDNSFKTKKQD